MRIVAGAWRGRQITAPDDARVRPTGDRVREAWMSIVAASIPGARVADLYAGSGALGLEALSRGAHSTTFVDDLPASLATIRSNADALGAGTRVVIHRGDVPAFVKGLEPHAFDLVFADPPWGHELASQLATQWLATPFAEVIGIEHRRDEVLPPGGDRRVYGETAITIYRTATAGDDPAILSADSTDDSES